MTRVIAVVDDLFFGAKILETAEQLKVSLRLARSPEELEVQARACCPALLIFDLNAETYQPLQAIRRVKADPELKDTPTLGFFSHVQHDLKAAATEAGCDRIMARSAFTAQLPEILRPYASP
ncbi:MAG: response regulator [Candidatus Methylomirabilota bacterium]